MDDHYVPQVTGGDVDVLEEGDPLVLALTSHEDEMDVVFDNTAPPRIKLRISHSTRTLSLTAQGEQPEELTLIGLSDHRSDRQPGVRLTAKLMDVQLRLEAINVILLEESMRCNLYIGPEALVHISEEWDRRQNVWGASTDIRGSLEVRVAAFPRDKAAGLAFSLTDEACQLNDDIRMEGPNATLRLREENKIELTLGPNADTERFDWCFRGSDRVKITLEGDRDAPPGVNMVGNLDATVKGVIDQLGVGPDPQDGKAPMIAVQGLSTRIRQCNGELRLTKLDGMIYSHAAFTTTSLRLGKTEAPIGSMLGVNLTRLSYIHLEQLKNVRAIEPNVSELFRLAKQSEASPAEVRERSEWFRRLSDVTSHTAMSGTGRTAIRWCEANMQRRSAPRFEKLLRWIYRAWGYGLRLGPASITWALIVGLVALFRVLVDGSRHGDSFWDSYWESLGATFLGPLRIFRLGSTETQLFNDPLLSISATILLVVSMLFTLLALRNLMKLSSD